MRRVVYNVAASLDGYIAGPGGEYDWIPADPDVDFGAIFAPFDTALMGRKSYEATQRGGGQMMGLATVVASRTLDESTPGVVVIRDVARDVPALKTQPGKDIWLWGGGELFRSVLEAGLVDAVDVSIVPVLLGGGIPLLPTPAMRVPLVLTSHRLYPRSGIVHLSYAVGRPAARDAV